MRKIITFATILGFIVTPSLNLSTEKTASAQMRQYAKQTSVIPIEIKGQVTKIKGDTITIRDEAGRIYQVKTEDPRALEEIKVGDILRVEGTVGQKKTVEAQQKKIRVKATSIQRVEGNGRYGGYVPENAPAQPGQ